MQNARYSGALHKRGMRLQKGEPRIFLPKGGFGVDPLVYSPDACYVCHRGCVSVARTLQISTLGSRGAPPPFADVTLWPSPTGGVQGGLLRLRCLNTNYIHPLHEIKIGYHK